MGLIAVTGASGFIGRHTCELLLTQGFDVRAVLRRPGGVPGCESVIADPLDADQMAAALAGASAVVHLAGRAHILRERSRDALAEFRRVNVEGSRALAAAASRAGVGQVVFVSSIAAVAVASAVPIGEDFPPAPGTPYGISKLEAEHALRETLPLDGVSCTILRPPMVFGPGMRGNPRALLRLIARGVPLPVGGVGGKRSMLYVANLAAAIGHVLASPPPTGIYHLADDPPLTISEFAERLGTALGRPARIVSVPLGMMTALARLGDHLEALLPVPITTDRLRRALGPLLVDARRFADVTAFRAPVPLDEAMRVTAAWAAASSA